MKGTDLLTKAVTNISNKDYKKAEKLLKKMLSKTDREGRIVARNQLGIVYEKTGKTKEAMILYEANINENTYTPHPYIRLAIYYEKMKEYRKALEIINGFFKMIEKIPKHYGVWGSSGTENLKKRQDRLLRKIQGDSKY